MVDITGLTKAEVLKALHDKSHCQGMSFLSKFTENFTIKDAKKMLDKSRYVDYCNGRIIKVNFENGSNTIDERLYDRDCGRGMCQYAVSELKRSKGLI